MRRGVTPQAITDRARIAAYLRRNVPLHLYEIGDLDPFFWPSTSWFAPPAPAAAPASAPASAPAPASASAPAAAPASAPAPAAAPAPASASASASAPAPAPAPAIDALCLVYRHPAMVTLVALGEGPELELLRPLVASVAAGLPDTFYAHTSPTLFDAIRTHRREPRGRHLKMVLAEPDAVSAVDTSDTEPLGPEALDEAEAFYREAYPDSWFDPRMLETGQYVAVRERGRLVCVAGVHVHSAEQRVAAIGNVATMKEHRGRGLARRATAAVCQRLRQSVDVIGLNVASDNAEAIRCYQRLGFRTVAEYDESLFQRGKLTDRGTHETP